MESKMDRKGNGLGDELRMMDWEKVEGADGVEGLMRPMEEVALPEAEVEGGGTYR